MARAPTWPDEMEDGEAVLRLQSLLLEACEGRRDLDLGREYKRLRKPLIGRPDLADVVPKFVRSHQDLGTFWSYIKAVSPQWAPRREHVREGFEPLFDRIEGRTRPPAASSDSTGRRTAAQQAQIVLALAPDALDGVEALLSDFERALHNGGPVDPEQNEAIEKLRQLRDALSQLIALAEGGAPLDEQVSRLRAIKDGVLQWSASPYGLNMGGLPLLGMSSVLGAGVAYLVNVISPANAAAAGYAVMGVHVATAAVMAAQGERKKPPR